MPVYEHGCEECGYEWEDIYSMKDPIPDVCPKCGGKKVKRLISWSMGKVELTGRELISKLRAEGKAMAQQAKNNETVAHDLYGTNQVYFKGDDD